MLDLLQAEVEKDEHNKANCFVLFILSHGHKGVVFGTDGYQQKNEGSAPATNDVREKDSPKNCIKIKKIVELFSSAKSLQGKPKLFFIQACQGGRVLGLLFSFFIYFFFFIISVDKDNAFNLKKFELLLLTLH